MLHAFISSHVSPDGKTGYAVVLARDFEDVKGPSGEDYIIETACSSQVYGRDAAYGAKLAYRMASRIASTQTCDVGDGNLEQLAVHFDDECPDGLPAGTDPFHDGILIEPADTVEWPYRPAPVTMAIRMARDAASQWPSYI